MSAAGIEGSKMVTFGPKSGTGVLPPASAGAAESASPAAPIAKAAAHFLMTCRCISPPRSSVVRTGERAHGLAVLAHRLPAVASGLAPEPAVHGHAEVVEEPLRRRVAAAQAGDPVEGQHDAEEHARVRDVEVLQRPEEALVLT